MLTIRNNVNIVLLLNLLYITALNKCYAISYLSAVCFCSKMFKIPDTSGVKLQGDMYVCPNLQGMLLMELRENRKLSAANATAKYYKVCSEIRC